MSSTMVMTMADPAPPLPTTTTAIRSSDHDLCCPSCGDRFPPSQTAQPELVQAQARIADLETQVRLLNNKATAAVDRWADYEDELSKLRAEKGAPPPPPKNETAPAEGTSEGHASGGFLQSGTGRFSALISRNKSTPNLHQQQLNGGSVRPGSSARTMSTPSPTAAQNEQLLQALTREKSLRKEAEGKLTATSREVEELSVSLFEQANEMVAEERRARAKLEERVGELERRDGDKKRRLERLESAMARIERVRTLLDN